MKLTWYVLTLIAMVVILFGYGKALMIIEQNKCRMNKELYGDVFAQIAPKTLAGKCLYECMLRLSGMLKEGGLIDAEKFGHFIMNDFQFIFNDSDKKPIDKATRTAMVTATNNCKMHRHLSEDRCETAALFAECIAAEAGKRGFNSMDMIDAIFEAYIVSVQKRQ